MKILQTVLLITVALAAADCTKKTGQLPRFGVVAIDTLLDNSRAECRIEYRFASLLNAGDSPALEAIEQANIGYFFQLEEFSGTAKEAMQASLRETAAAFMAETAQGGAGGASYEITAESEGEVFDTVMNYTISRWSYTGGAHGIYGIECHTYALNGGYELTTADLFGNDELPVLTEAIRRKIYESYEAQNDEQLVALGFFPEYIAPTENFRISEAGVTFYYNPYEIGCYALGPVEVTLNVEETDSLRRGR